MSADEEIEQQTNEEIHNRPKEWMIWVLFWLLGISSWIDITGLFNELLLMVNDLSEGYEIWSYITLIIQLANIGPLIYGLIPTQYKTQKFVIITGYFIFGISFFSMIIMCLFWDTQTLIFGSKRSVILFITTFGASLCDCMTSIIFWVFVSWFPTQYMTALSAGESSSGIISAILIWIQQLNRSNDNPRYSVSIYIFCIAIFIPLSAISFFILLKFSNKGYFINAIDRIASVKNHKIVEIVGDEHSEDICNDNVCSGYWHWIIMISVLSGIQNGMIPSISSFALVPYGNTVYILSYTIYNCLAPLFSLLPAMLSKYILNGRFIIISCIASICGAIYILIMALQSPNQLGLGDNGYKNSEYKLFWSVVMVIVYVLYGLLLTICKTCIYLIIKKSYLMKINGLNKDESVKNGLSKLMEIVGYGVQIGSFCGAGIFFLLVNVACIFEQQY